MSASHAPFTPKSSASPSLWFFLSHPPVFPHFSLRFPRVLPVKNINSVLYGWLDGRSKFLLFLTPAWLCLKNTSNQWVFEGHNHTSLRNPLCRGKSGVFVAERQAHMYFSLSFFCPSSCLPQWLLWLVITILDLSLESVRSVRKDQH